jgi:hypothetical protein
MSKVSSARGRRAATLPSPAMNPKRELGPATAAQSRTGSGSIDGSTTITCNTSTMLFGGAVPPNGFVVQPLGCAHFCQRQRGGQL